MAYAIVTKYLGPTNRRGGRVKASTARGSLTIPYEEALDNNEAHAKAAEALARRLGWFGRWHQASMPDDSGYCFMETSGPLLCLPGDCGALDHDGDRAQ